jgi:CRP-like cAMP-binding protein
MKIKDVLDKIGHFSESERAFFEEIANCKDYRKGEFILQKGEVCRSLFYILDGAVLQHNAIVESSQNVVDLHYKDDWISNHHSLISQEPSDTSIEAYTDCQLMELSLEAIHSLIARSPSFLQFGKLLEQSKVRTYFYDQSLTPLQKYQYLLENRRDIFQYFPLKIIAAYLKITPETLSRVREKISKGIS